MTRWNPNDPAVIGPEFLAGYDSSITANRFAPVVQRFRSNAAETIANLRLHHSVTSVGYPAAYLAEIHPQGSEVDNGAFTTVTYAPNVLTGIVGTVTDEAGGAAVVADFATWPPYYNTTDVRMGASSSLDLEFASAGLAATGRIAAVAVEVLTLWGVYPLGNGPDYKRRTVVSLVNGGTLHGTQARVIPNNTPSGEGGIYFYTWGEINPITGQPWTQADIQAFDTATTRIRLARQTGDTGTWIVPAVRLVVAYETTERRVARGVFQSLAQTPAGWSPVDVPLATPTGVANWAKANATDYALVVRQADQGNLTPFAANAVNLSTVHAVAGHDPPADLPSYTGSVVTVTFQAENNTSLVGQSMTAAELVAGRAVPFVLRTTAPATSADGQPYAQVRTPGILLGSGASQQEFRTSGSDDYAGLRVTAGWFAGVPTEDLVVEVRRRSDSVLMGTFTVTPDLVAGSPTGRLSVVEVKAPTAITLASGVQYYLDFASATPGGTAWIVGILAVEAGGGGVLYQEATYSGGTDQADPIDGSASTALTYTPADYAAVLDAAVDSVTGLDVTDASQDLPGPLPDGCAMTGLPYAAIEWVATALGGDFAGYRLQREHPVLGWQDIAYITTEAVESYMDQCGRLGVEECYRIRVERTDGATSYYTDPICVTVPAAGCGLTFTSNEYPAAGVGYADTYDSDARRGYDFPEAREVQYRTMYGRDYQVAFRPLTRRGVAFGRRLLVATLGALAGPGPAALDALRDLAWATTSYICVRDEAGNRWYGSLTVPSGTVQQPSGIHWADIEFVETTSTPSTPDAIPCDVPVGGPLSFVGGGEIFFMDGDPMDAVV